MPGHYLDFRTALARQLAASGHSVRSAARAVHVDHAYISRVLNGRQQPSPSLVEALDALVGAGGALAALASSNDEEQRARVRHSLAKPTALDGAAVEALANVLATQRRADDLLPASALIPAVDTHAATMRRLLDEARGPHVRALAEVAAEYVQFAGWLHAEARNDETALSLLGEAVDMAEEIDHGPLVAQALNFHAYVARQQKRPRAVARLFRAAYDTPGAHPLQRVGDGIQSAAGLGDMGLIQDAHRLLGEATDLLDRHSSTPPPGTAYWLSSDYMQLNLGIAYLSLGQPREAVQLLQGGLDALPDDQREAEWTAEHRVFLARARES